MELRADVIVEGKVTGITNFGAFVSLPGGKSGMVHISEISNSYVTNIRDHLSEGQSVTVRILGTDSSGRINLSIKKAAAPEMGSPPPRRPPPSREPAFAGAARAPESFEAKLSKFLTDSNSKISRSKLYAEKPTKRRAR